YSVSETSGNRKPWNGDALCAVDATIPLPALIAACKRLDEEIRAGRLEKVVEWFGTFDGRVVVGYNNVRNTNASADSSHLFHLHMGFDRGRVNENHDDLYDILTGGDM